MKKVFFIIPAACMFALTLIVSMHAAENNPAGAQLATHHYTVKRAGSPITVDGRLDEPLWSKAEPVSFVKKNGGQPEQATKAWVVWDDSYIYFAWDCEDSHIWSTMEKRDEPLYNEEVVEVFISADGDNTSYLEIEVNPLGTLWDGYIVNTVKRRVGILAWNSTGLKWAVHIDGTLNDREETDKGWSVEMALPLNDIFTAPNKPPKAGDRWRINLYRIDLPDGPGNPGEPCAWSPVSGETFHDPDRFGEIVFSAEVVR